VSRKLIILLVTIAIVSMVCTACSANHNPSSGWTGYMVFKINIGLWNPPVYTYTEGNQLILYSKNPIWTNGILTSGMSDDQTYPHKAIFMLDSGYVLNIHN
jgi:hypothetical protein